jgi:hypothetical protein
MPTAPRRFGCARSIPLATVWAATLALSGACSLDWSDPLLGDADGGELSEIGDVPAEDAPPEAEADVPAEADAEADGDTVTDADADGPDDSVPETDAETETETEADADTDGPDDSVPETDAETDADVPEVGCSDAGGCPDDGNPCNGTEYCDGASGTCRSTGGVPDGSGCGGGLCCGGLCRAGANCCSSADCPFACTGGAAPCADIGSMTDQCAAQAGCTVELHGVCVEPGGRDCGFSSETDCNGCGCSWDSDLAICTGGSPTSCSSWSTQRSCEACARTWSTSVLPTSCSGTAVPCPDFTAQPGCEAQWGCWWDHRICSDSTFQCL